MQFEVTFNTSKSNEKVLIDVPTNATVAGSCSKNSSVITLKWPSSIEKKEHSLSILFMLLNHDEDYSVPKIDVVIIKDSSFSNASFTEPSFNFTLNVTDGLFLTPTNRSFKCDAQTTLELETKDRKYELRFAHLQMDAFRDTSNKTDPEKFQKEAICSADRHTYAVGAGMIFMIIFIILLIVGVAGGGVYYYKKHKLPAGSGYENM